MTENIVCYFRIIALFPNLIFYVVKIDDACKLLAC